MNKRLTIMMILLAGFGTLQAQNGFNMPLSQFGTGSSELPYTFPLASRMGGVVYTSAGNNFINPFNPASYANIETESFVFDMGFNLQTSTLRSGNQKANDADGNIGYLAIGLPLTKWWKLAAGLIPFSSVDYESVSTQTGAGYGTMKTIYDGTGGVNEVFLGTAFNIPAGKGRKLQAGVNAGLLTGSIERAISYEFQGNDTTYYVNSRRYKKTTFRNIVLDFGVQMWQELGERYTLGVGLTFKPYMDMTVSDLALKYTYASDESLVDTIFPAMGQNPEFDSRLEQPMTMGFGISMERNRRWKVAMDATFGWWSGLRYTEDEGHSIFGSSALRYGPFSRYAAGFERIGNMDASSYWGRIGWSMGAHMEQGAMRLMVDGTEHSLSQWGVGAGMSLPMRKGRSLLTLSLGYNSIGNTDVLQRDCFTIGIAVSSCERWFVKRKYN